jgi:hypothetical protein
VTTSVLPAHRVLTCVQVNPGFDPPLVPLSVDYAPSKERSTVTIVVFTCVLLALDDSASCWYSLERSPLSVVTFSSADDSRLV